MRAETTTSFSIAEPHSMEDSPFSQANILQTELLFTIKNSRQRYEIQDKCSVGRGSEVDLQVDDATLSRRHFEISKTGDNFVLKDLGSTNGTYVNGHSINKSVLLKSGDVISSGAVQFKFIQRKTRRLHPFDSRSSQPSDVAPPSHQTPLKKWVQFFFWGLLFLAAGLTILISLFPRQKTIPKKSSSITPGQLQADVLAHEASQAIAMGEFQRALTSLEGASRKNGDQAAPFQKSVEKAITLRHDLERENGTWEQVKEKQIRVSFHLERAYQQMSERDLTAALNSFQEVLFIDPGNAKANDGIYQLRLLQNAQHSLSQKASQKPRISEASPEEIQSILEQILGGDLKTAYQDYLPLKKEYPRDRQVQDIEKKLIGAMEQTAERAFAEAAIFQNIPDFEAARKRWQLVVELLPSTHPYFKKAQEKLSRSYL